MNDLTVQQHIFLEVFKLLDKAIRCWGDGSVKAGWDLTWKGAFYLGQAKESSLFLE